MLISENSESKLTSFWNFWFAKYYLNHYGYLTEAKWGNTNIFVEFNIIFNFF